MIAPVCGTEGSLDIRLGIDAGRVAAVHIRSTRPLGVTRVFLGKPVDRVLDTLPLLYSVCATAQSAAAVQAAEAALGIRPSDNQRRAREALVLAETAREHLIRCLLGWADWLGEPPAPQALGLTGRLRGALGSALYPGDDAFKLGGGRLAPDRIRASENLDALESLLAGQILGLPIADWLAIQDAAGLAAWATGGRSLGARAIARVLALGWADLSACSVQPLGETAPEELDLRLTAPDADEFIARPTWNGAAGETGALAREAHRPLLADLAKRYGNGLLTRLTARLSELAGLPGRIAGALDGIGAEPEPAPAPSTGSGSGSGIGQVEAARGRLIHRVEVEAGQVQAYRILAPTEWNFHPRGVLASGLLGLDANAELDALVALTVEAIDPCVGYRIEIQAAPSQTP